MRPFLLAAALWAALYSYLAIARHDAFESNAFDLGYVTQTLWSTVHGQPFRFTTVDGLPVSPEGTLDVSRLHQPPSLLAFHVEPLLLLVAPLFALWPDPRLLLVVQAVALAAGGVAAAALGRQRLGGSPAAIVFGLAFLLSPSVAAAALSDFHAVSLAAAFLMATLAFISVGRPRLALGTAVLAAAGREDATILIATLGAYLLIRAHLARRERTGPLSWRERVRVRGSWPLSAIPPHPNPLPPGEGTQEGLRPLVSHPCFQAKSLRRRPHPNPSLTSPGPFYQKGSILPGGEGIRGQLPGEEGIPPDPFDRCGRLGLALLLGAGGWGVAAFGLILPYFNGTLGALRRGEPAIGSIFWHRYAWLGPSPLAALGHVARDPSLLVGWFGQADVQAYLATLALTGGGLALLSPGVLLAAAPIVLQDALSSFDWMRSGGAHYSIIVVPILIFGAIEAVRRLAARIAWRRARTGALAVVLVAVAANHAWLGASPVLPGLRWPAPGAREQAVEAILRTISASAAVSATSSVYPHLATRDRAYWFPAVNGADVVAVDVATSSAPIDRFQLWTRTNDLLAADSYRVDAAAPGFLLLRRADRTAAGPPRGAAAIPDRFYDFARASPAERARATPLPAATFGESLHLDAFRVDESATQTIFGPTARVTTFWHADRPTRTALDVVFYATRRPDGAIVGELARAAPEPIWYPTSRWQPGETVQMTLLLPRVRDLQAVGVAVVDPSTGRRLPIFGATDSALWENGTIARIARFDGGA